MNLQIFYNIKTGRRVNPLLVTKMKKRNNQGYFGFSTVFNVFFLKILQKIAKRNNQGIGTVP